jgi:hypothetical protein
VAQRSPHNARYQKHTKPGGKTRRSAASVKPKRDLGASATGSKSSDKKGSTPRKSYVMALTPMGQKWRRVWWVCIGVSFFFALSYLALTMVAKVTLPPGLNIAMLALCYLFLLAALFIDWRIVKPSMRRAAAGQGDPVKPAKKTDDKPTDASAS